MAREDGKDDVKAATATATTATTRSDGDGEEGDDRVPDDARMTAERPVGPNKETTASGSGRKTAPERGSCAADEDDGRWVDREARRDQDDDMHGGWR